MAPPAWQGSEAAMAALQYVESCATLFDALDGAVAAMVNRGYDLESARTVVAWNYVATIRAGMGLT